MSTINVDGREAFPNLVCHLDPTAKKLCSRSGIKILKTTELLIFPRFIYFS